MTRQNSFRKISFIACLLAALFVQESFCLYGASSKVVKLTASNFKDKVINSNQLWFIEFYAPWCGHCKTLAPEFEKLAKGLDGIINVGAVDMTTDQQAGSAYGIKGFPTLKFFGNNKNKPTDYNGQRTTQGMMDFAFERAKLIANSKAFYKGGQQQGGQQRQQQQQQQRNTGDQKGSTGKVETLTSGNFASNVYNSKFNWIIEFYAPWCGHCKQLLPNFEKAAAEVTGVRWGKVDCTQEQSLCGQFSVQGYPTIKQFEAGSKGSSNAIDYNGGRSSAALIDHAKELLEKAVPPKDIKRLMGPADYTEYCEEAKLFCVVFLLQHKLDVGQEGHLEQVQLVTKITDTFKARGVNVLWSQGGDQYEFEDRLGVAGNYPQAVAFHVKKGKYLAMIQAFTASNIESWINSIFGGRLRFFDLPQNLPEIKTIKA